MTIKNKLLFEASEWKGAARFCGETRPGDSNDICITDASRERPTHYRLGTPSSKPASIAPVTGLRRKPLNPADIA